MPRFAANLTMMFTEVPFLDRFARAAAAGFGAVEFLFPYDHPPEAVAARLRDAGLTQALFNAPPGDWAAGERGLAALPGRERECAEGVERAIVYARALGNRLVHVMAGLRPEGADEDALWEVYLRTLAAAAGAAAPHGLTILLEPINRRSMPGYFLDSTDKGRRAVEHLRAAGHANVALQFDVFHRQIMEGDVATGLRDLLPITGHVQVAGVPERHEPDAGEVNYPYLFDLLDGLGYDGFVGCEYVPAGRTEDGLGWFRRAQGAMG